MFLQQIDSDRYTTNDAPYIKALDKIVAPLDFRGRATVPSNNQ